MAGNDIVYFGINDWDKSVYPQHDPFIEWLKPNLTKGEPFYIFRDDQWCKKNQIVVCECTVDQSCNFNITASRKWVEEHCPCVFGTEFDLTESIEIDDTVGLPFGYLDGHFLPYTPENFGYWYEEVWGVPEGQVNIENDAGKKPTIELGGI